MCTITLLRTGKVKSARKDYECNACTWFREQLEYVNLIRMSFADKRTIIKIKQQGYKINKGDPYHWQVIKQDGEIYTVKYIPEMNEICHKYELYPDC